MEIKSEPTAQKCTHKNSKGSPTTEGKGLIRFCSQCGELVVYRNGSYFTKKVPKDKPKKVGGNQNE